MRNETRFTMMMPAAGFTSRVMARIAERERAQARRRALIGSALLAVFALAVLMLIAWWVLSWVAAVVSIPQVLVVILNTSATCAFWASKMAEALWVVLLIVAENVGFIQMLALGVGVLALTMLWVRVVIGPFQRSSQTFYAGGLSK